MKLLGLAVISIALWSPSFARIASHRSGRRQEKAQMLETNRVPILRRDDAEIDEENEIEDEVAVENQLTTSRFLNACEDCKTVVTKIDAIIKDPAKLDELKVLLELVCNMAPSSYRDQCKEVVENIDTIVQELEPYLSNPETFCREIHMCGNDRTSRVLQLFLLFVKKYVYQIDDPARANDVLCQECILVMNEAKTLIEDKSIQDGIKQELHSICNLLGSLKDECDSLVDEFFPVVIEELEALLKDPRSLCKELGLCNSVRMAIDGFPVTDSRGSTSQQTANRKLQVFSYMLGRLHTTNGLNVGCVMCTFGIGTVVNAIKEDPQILDEIAEILQHVCDILPQQGIRPGCVDFLRTYLKPMIIMTLEEINSTQICEDFHLCSQHDRRQISRNRANLDWKSEVMCDACKTLAGFLKYEFRQREFQQALANELKQVCDLVPGSYATQCDNLVDQYVPYLVQLLVQELNPKILCPELHMCPSQTDENLQEIDEDEDEDDE